MKKKITAIFLCIALAATAIVGASLAYFTDTDSETNTFTVGNVDIKLIEQQTGENGLEDFDQNKTLMPGTSKDGSAVSKIVTVQNTGKNAAWVWVDIKVPTVLVSTDIDGASESTFDALHCNYYGHFFKNYNASGRYMTSAIADGIIDSEGNVLIEDMVAVKDGLWDDFAYIGTTEDGYTIFRAKMINTLPSGKISLPCLQQVYMDWRIIANDNGSYTFPETDAGNYHYDGTEIPKDTKWEVVVDAYAVQADGINSVDDAIKAYENQTKA